VSSRSRYKSAAVVLSSSEGDSDVEPVRIRASGKEKVADNEKLVPASRGYDSYHPFSPRTSYVSEPGASTPLRTLEQAQIEVAFPEMYEAATPGLTNYASSPEKNISSPEKRDSPAPPPASLTKDVEMADEDEMVHELEMEIFGAAESGF
jgi:hypothetical protein